MEQRDKMLDILCQMSDQQFDPIAKDKLRGMIGKPDAEIKDELLGLIDDIAYCSWSSSFEISALRIIWEMMGGTQQEVEHRNILINEACYNPQLQKELTDKYKWIVDRWN